MAKRLFLFFFCGFLLILPLFLVVRADLESDVREVTEELKKFNELLQSQEVDFQSLNKQLNDIKSQVSAIENQIVQKEKEVKLGEEALVYQRGLLNERAKSYYKNINKNAISIINLLTAENLSESLQNFFYQKTLVDQDRNTITRIVLYIKDLETKKAELKSEKSRLAVINEEIDKQTKILAGEISETRQKIAQLSERQQSLVSQRLSSLNIPRSAGTSSRGCSDDRGVNPGFSPRLAFFTYGAPHRKGLNQYGALGRAIEGQNEEAILSAYYPNMSIKKDYDQNVQISTTTGWSGSIEDYVKRIYEVPDSWTDNNLAVLKAQAVAARTYALNVTGNGSKQICTSEQCQVFKPDPKGGNWEQAVEATKGWVLMDGGGPGFTQYASTHGGYILNLNKFDGRVGNPSNFSELNDRAYDKSSPWFYCDWGARGQYSNTAWLRPSEVADIANVILLARRDSSTGEHLYQTDKGHPYGGEVWNEERVKQELKNRGITPYSSVSSVSVGADFGSGKTNSISISGDHGAESFSGDEFKSWFNLRAPANIQIVGPLYNVETQ